MYLWEIFDFVKKIFENKEVEEIKKEKIAFSDIQGHVEKKRKETEIREKEILGLIRERINTLNRRIEEKIDLLKKADIDSKKAEDRIKYITKEGRKEYIELIEFFINNLNNLKENKLEKTILDIDTVFLSFNKSSRISYEKTTILIGKEMEDIKNELKFFSKELINLFDENRKIANSFDTISLIELKFRQLEKIKEEIKMIQSVNIFFRSANNL